MPSIQRTASSIVVWIILLMGCLYLVGMGVQVLFVISSLQESQGIPLVQASAVVAGTRLVSMNTNRTAISTTTTSSHHLPMFMLQSTTTGIHHPDQQRTVLSLTTVLDELYDLAGMVDTIITNHSYHSMFDAIHINIPWLPLRSSPFPHTQTLIDMFPDDPRVIIHRLADYGPMTRYFGALAYEQHPETIIITFDVDTDQFDIAPLRRLIQASREMDPNAIWCNYGEDFIVIDEATIRPYWDTYNAYLSKDQTLAWNQVYFCRAARGFLVKPKFFQHFVLNATDYHRSCFWDDDRFLSFQMAVLGIQRKSVHTGDWYLNEYLPRQEQKRKCQTDASSANVLLPKVQRQERHRRLGSLSEVNVRNRADYHCTMAFLKTHPDLFPLAYNVSKGCPDEQLQSQMKVVSKANNFPV